MKKTLECLILEGVLLQLAKHFTDVVDDKTSGEIKHKITCVHIPATDQMQIQNYLLNPKLQGNIVFPLMGLTVDTLSINYNSGYNVGAVNRMAKSIPTDTNSGYLIKKFKFVPTVFDCTLNFLTQDYWESFSFCTKWMWGILNKENLSFNCAFAGLRFSIRLELLDNISMTPKDNSLENTQNYFTSTATLKVYSFISDNKNFNDLPTGSQLQQINIFPSFPGALPSIGSGVFDEDAYLENNNNEKIIIKSEGY